MLSFSSRKIGIKTNYLVYLSVELIKQKLPPRAPQPQGDKCEGDQQAARC